MVKNIVRTSAAAVTSLGLIAAFSGIAGASAGTVTGTGPDSNNTVKSTTKVTTHVDNDNNLSLHNSNHQWGGSGDAKVHENTTGGSATSGNVSNTNSVSANISVSNSMPSWDPSSLSNDTATISNTGPDSNNRVTAETTVNTTVNNDNDISISNSNEQSGESGDASVTDNTTGGNATSGSVTNSNSSSFTITVSN